MHLIVALIPSALNTSQRHLAEKSSNNLLSMESERSTVLSDYRPHCTPADMTIGPHILCSNILVLLRTGQSSEDLDSETLTSVKEHIRRLESEIVTRDKHFQMQATSLQHERDLAVQDFENHKSIFAPIRRLPSDVLLYIFQTSIDDRVKLDVKTIPWLLGYICHHWRALSRSASSLWTDIFVENSKQSAKTSSLPFQKFAAQDLNRNDPSS
ncbi:hypothetical protein ARMGADRAFT_1088726 [Armillaria gallica]|uniref:F-box domain-containing protein n=1 Tax=Armillaria gallica TaxID=47427 RepID=A0A2H3CZU3_ARMGA|nr:hypothetical protein ARMGADRAFT_1088726 [Armillaria gallica]